MTIHRNMFDKPAKGAVTMENENEEQPAEEVQAEETPSEQEEEAALSQEDIISALLQQAHEEEMESMRAMGLYGDINEEKAQEVINALMVLWDSAKSRDPEGKEIKRPFDFFISTNGGSADDMFAIYDLMTVIKNQGIDIGTIGLGKVMSAGVLLLAAGTKGKRRVARNCRIMIHSVLGANHGSLHNMINEMEAIEQLQNMYINCTK